MKLLALTAAHSDFHRHALRQAGFVVDEVHTADAALGMLHAFAHDALLAVVSAERTGTAALEVLRARRRDGHALPAVALLTPDMQHWAPVLQAEHVPSLPFAAPAERIALALRSHPAPRPAGGLVIDHAARRARLDGEEIVLTAQEYLLLELLSLNPGRLFRRDEILRRAWPSDYAGDDRVVDTYVKRLRRKLGEQAVETVRHFGYRFPLREPEGPAQDTPGPPGLLARQARELLHAATTGEALAAFLQLVGGSGVCAVGVQHQRSPAPPPVWAGVPPHEPPRSLAHDAPARPGCLAMPLLNPAGNEWGRVHVCLSAEIPEAEHELLRVAVDLLGAALLRQEERAQRQAAQAALRDLTRTLESRVEERTRQLVAETRRAQRMQRVLEGLQRLGRALERTRGVHDVAARALPLLCGALLLDGAALLRVGGSPSVLGSHGLPLEAAIALAAARAAPAAPRRWYDLRELPAGFARGRGRTVLATPTERFELIVLSRESGWQVGGRALALAVGSLAFALERNLSFEYLTRTALTDQRSGLPNLQAFLADAYAELAFTERQDAGFALALLEFTNLKRVNERDGYAAGSDVLHDLVRVLRGTLRAEDRLYRLTGNTLAVLLRAAPASPGAGPVGRLARHAREAYGEGVHLRASLLHCPADARDLSDLLRLSLERLAPLHTITV